MKAAIAGARAALESSAPSAAEPVAWMDDGSTYNGTGSTSFRVITDATKRTMPESVAEAYRTPLYLAAPPAPAPSAASEREAASWRVMTEAMVDEFLEDYEMVGEDAEGRDACYTPSEGERALIKDAVMGLLGDADERGRVALSATSAKDAASEREVLTDELFNAVGAALMSATDHLEFEALERSHCNDMRVIQLGLAVYGSQSGDAVAIQRGNWSPGQPPATRAVSGVKPALLMRHEDACGDEVGPATPYYSEDQYRAARPHAPEDAKEAARYRWLRDVSVPPHNFYLSVPDEFKDVRYTPAEVNAAIDAALSQGGGAG